MADRALIGEGDKEGFPPELADLSISLGGETGLGSREGWEAGK